MLYKYKYDIEKINMTDKMTINCLFNKSLISTPHVKEMISVMISNVYRSYPFPTEHG